jgi:predicted nucleic acid-binding protein
VIVVDANVLFPYVFEMETTVQALRIRGVDPDWRFPRLWRQEFTSALLKYVRAGRCGSVTADKALAKALVLFGGHELEVSDRIALNVAREFGLSAYDALYLTLARELEVVLVTADRALVRRCPGIAVLMDEFGR